MAFVVGVDDVFGKVVVSMISIGVVEVVVVASTSGAEVVVVAVALVTVALVSGTAVDVFLVVGAVIVVDASIEAVVASADVEVDWDGGGVVTSGVVFKTGVGVDMVEEGIAAVVVTVGDDDGETAVGVVLI